MREERANDGNCDHVEKERKLGFEIFVIKFY